MIQVLLSLGALNALIPLLVIIILIAAAGMAMRGFSFFNLFGIETLFGIGSGSRSSLKGKSMFTQAYGPKSVILRTGGLRTGKFVNIGGRYQAYRNTRRAERAGDREGKDIGTRRSFMSAAQRAMAEGNPNKLNELSALQGRYPDTATYLKELTLKAANLKTVGLAVDIDKIVAAGGATAIAASYGRIWSKSPKASGLYRSEFKNQTQQLIDENKKNQDLSKQARSKAIENLKKTYQLETARELSMFNTPIKGVTSLSSLAATNLMWQRKEYLQKLQANYESSFKKAHAALIALDKQREEMQKANRIMSERDYEQRKGQIVKELRKAASRYYDEANRGMTVAEITKAGTAAAAGMGFALIHDEGTANKHFKTANEILGKRFKYEGNRTFPGTEENADVPQYKSTGQRVPQYKPNEGHIVTEKEEIDRFLANQKKKKEDKEKAEAEKMKKEPAGKKDSGNGSE